jgi:hypothetical protein
MDYITKILKILELAEGKDSSVAISLKRDCPAVLENQHFKFVLAPRVEEE